MVLLKGRFDIMKRILALNFFPAFTPVSNGGESKLYNFYKALSKHHHITLLTSTHPEVSEETIYHTSTFIERRIPKDPYFYQVWNEFTKNNSGNKGDLSAPVLTKVGKYPTLFHAAYLEEYPEADAIFHDFPFTVDYDIFIGTDDKPRVYNSHNCETNLYGSLHEGEKLQYIVDIVAAAEKKLLGYSDLVLYCSEGDRDSFVTLSEDKKLNLFYSPNGMTAYCDALFLNKTKIKKSVIFVGSSHLPNVTAALYVAQVIAPKCPEITFDIIGTCLPEGKYPKNVCRHGRVTDKVKIALFKNATLALNPMAAGSGSNIKVFDYFSYGLPIVSTKFGMRGIDAENGIHFIESDLELFHETINKYTSNSEIDCIESIGLAGKLLATQKFTWTAIVEDLVPKIDSLISTKKKNNYALVLNDYNSFSGIGGGGTRTRGIYEAVNSICDVIFLCFSANNTLTVEKYNKHITVISIPKTQEHVNELNEINSQFHISSDDIISSRHCTKNALLDSVYQILRKNARFIIAEHCYMTPLPIKYSDRFIHSSQNNETKLKSSLLEWHPQKRNLLADVERVERDAVEKAGASIAVSDDDAYSLLENKRTSGPMLVVRNGSQLPVEISESVLNDVKSKIISTSAVFLGSAHMPNVDAVNYLIKNIVPKCPSVQFHIIGSVCNSINSTPPKNVVLWGIVDEETKCAILQQSMFAINPVNTGSGSNVKLADFFANGLFVVSTNFGIRGYPDNILRHIELAEVEDFSEVINTVIKNKSVFTDEMKNERKSIFHSQLSMVGISEKFVSLLENFEKPKKRALFVTYRYTHPEMGGAETNLKRFIQALGASNEFEIDVVAAQVSKISNVSRFADHYTFDGAISAPIEMNNVRFARFPVENNYGRKRHNKLEFIWRVQPMYEKAIFDQLGIIEKSGFAWGWSHPEGDSENNYRWAYTSSGFNLDAASTVSVKGYVASETLLTVQSVDSEVYLSVVVDKHFTLDFSAKPGVFEIIASSKMSFTEDPRPLGFILNELKLNGINFDISSLSLSDAKNIDPNRVFNILDEASERTRVPLKVNLTGLRGPESCSLEGFITSNVSKYDLVITHNIVFKPATVAIEAAKNSNIPSLIIPHSHLDDDYYHFPDILASARNATKILAVPKAASDFYASKGCNAEYLPGGADLDEEFTQNDINAFKSVYPGVEPFVLVLGRKSGAKGYRDVISSVGELNKRGLNLRIVMIGPDDDGLSINDNFVTYLDRQPRSVVRGALMSCFTLVNMSVSESFGIVLLEAWLAGKPVIANKMCVAFNDMAINEENALMVDRAGLELAIERLSEDTLLADKLAKNGFQTAQNFGWKVVEDKFVDICLSTVSQSYTSLN